MNLTKLVYPAVMAGALLMSTSAHAQQDKAKALANTWADDMRRIVDQQAGEARRSALTQRTAKLSEDLKRLTCANNAERVSIFGMVRAYRADKNLPVEVKYDETCDGGTVTGSVSLAKINLDADDAAYKEAMENNQTISNYLSGWGHDVRLAIDTINDRSARKRKVDEFETRWEDTINRLKCHPQVKFDFKQAAEREKDKRFLAVHLIAAGACQGDRWKVLLQIATIDDNAKDAKSSNWTMVAKDMFPDAKSFTSDAKKQDYAAKFKSGGDYITKLNTIACSDADHTTDTVRNEFKNKVEPLRKLFFVSEPALSCTNGHLIVAVRVEALKSDPKNDPKAKK